jgi:alpha-1,6-mannosyltransferase
MARIGIQFRRYGPGLWLLAITILSAGIYQLVLGAAAQRFPRLQWLPAECWIAASVLQFLLYLLLVILLTKFVSKLYDQKRLALFIVVVSVVFRLQMLWISPVLSDDLYRYRWEGMLQAAGGNPYAVAPDDPAWSQLRDETFRLIPIPDYPAGYGPLALMAERLAFTLVAAVWDDPWQQAIGMKLPAALADLVVIALLLGWLRARGRPLVWVSVYALCPLVIVEFWGMGHNDALVLAFLVASFWALDVRRDWLGFLLLGAAVATKWWPALLLPVAIGYSRETPRRALLAALGLGVVPLAMLPYWTDLSLNMKFMGGFAGGWRNNDSLFGITYWLAGEDFETAKRWTLRLIALWCAAVPLLFRERTHGALASITGILLLAANCHPWYLTWVLPFLVFVPWPPLLLWAGLVPLFYEVLIGWHLLGEWHGSRPGRWLVYLPVFGLMAAYAMRALATTRRRPSDSSPGEQPPAELRAGSG